MTDPTTPVEIEPDSDSDKPITYTLPDSTIVYRASAIGRCIRSLVASRRGFEPMPYKQEWLDRFKAGHQTEPIVLAHLAKNGWDIYRKQEESELEIRPASSTKPRIIVMGHWDALGHHYPDPNSRETPDTPVCLIEVKRMSDGMNREWERKGWSSFVPYAWQTSCYAHSAHLSRVVLARGVHKDDKLTIKTQMFMQPPIPLPKIKARILMIEAFVNSSSPDLPGCDFPNFPCPYFHLHDDEKGLSKASQAIEEIKSPELIALLARHKMTNNQIKELSEAKETLKKEIVPLFRSQHPLQLQAKNGKDTIYCRPQSTRKLNTDRLSQFLSEAGGSLDDFYDDGAVYDHFEIKSPKSRVPDDPFEGLNG